LLRKIVIGYADCSGLRPCSARSFHSLAKTLGRCPKPRVRHVAGVRGRRSFHSLVSAPHVRALGRFVIVKEPVGTPQAGPPRPFLDPDFTWSGTGVKGSWNTAAPKGRGYAAKAPWCLCSDPRLWLWGWERRERSDRRPQPPSLTAASAGCGAEPHGLSWAQRRKLRACAGIIWGSV